MAPRKRARRKPNTGTIRYKPGRASPYETTFPLGRGIKPRYDSFDTLAEATAHLDKLTAERDNAINPRNIAGGSMGLHAFVTLWLSIKKPQVKIKSFLDYQYQCGLAVNYLGAARRIDSIARTDAQLMYNAYHAQGYKNIAQLRQVLSQAFDYAIDEEYVYTNPFRRAKAPNVERPARIVLTKTQRAAMLDAVRGDPYEILWHLYSRLGLRRGEGLGLLWANINWDAQTITIVQQYTRAGGQMVKETPKTKRSRRTFPVPDDIIAMLRTLQRTQLTRAAADPEWAMTGLVFTDEHGERLDGDWIYQRWCRLRDQLGLPPSVTIHDLRHTALTIMEQGGIAESIRMAFAGHSSAAMARKYADHADLEALRAALAKMG